MVNVNFLVLLLGWLFFIFCLASLCRQKLPNQKELTRKIVHIGTGPIIPFAWWFEVPKEIAIPIASIITIILFVNYRYRLVPSIEDIERKSFGTIAYGLSITLLIILFWPENAAAVSAGVLVMALGDGFAGLIGKKVNSKSWKILDQKKSIAGTLTMTITTGIVLIGITLITNTPFNMIKILLVTFLAVALEQLSFRGIDNLTVPLGVAISWLCITNI